METNATHEHFQVASGGSRCRKDERITRINIYPIDRGLDAREVFFQICIRVANVSEGEGASEGIVWKRIRVGKEARDVTGDVTDFVCLEKLCAASAVAVCQVAPEPYLIIGIQA